MTDLDDAELLRRFEDRSLDHSAWNHAAHLRITYLYVRSLPPAEALEAVRTGIQSFNAANNIEQTETGGYHETLTQTWFRLVLAAARTTPPSTPTADSRAFLRVHPQLLDKKLPLRHYTREMIMSWKARTTFVAPDIHPLPPLAMPA